MPTIPIQPDTLAATQTIADLRSQVNDLQDKLTAASGNLDQQIADLDKSLPDLQNALAAAIAERNRLLRIRALLETPDSPLTPAKPAPATVAPVSF